MDCTDTEGSSAKSRSRTIVSAGLRAALASGAALAVVLAALGAAQAAAQPKPHHAKREQPKKEPPPKPLDMPLIEVSISKQQLTLFEMGEPIAHAPVSTGMAGHLTPTGIFSVIGKEIFHRSNIYSGAPMPYMQRITWSGVALHAGVLPGYAASHGCIRMPHDFAVKLYGLTHLGARVLVVPHEVPPVAFENAKLFTRPKPATDKTAEATLPVPGAVHITTVHVVRTAESQMPSVMSDAVDAAAPALADVVKPKPPQDVAAAPAQVSEPKASEAPAVPAALTQPDTAEPAKQTAAAPAEKAPSAPAADAAKDATTPAATQRADEATKSGTTDGPAAPARAEQPATTAASQKGGEAATGTVMVKPIQVTSPQPIEVQKSFEPAREPTQGTQTFQPVPAAQTAPAAAPAAPAAPAAQPTQAAQPAPTPEVKSAPAPTVTAADEFYGPERPLRPGPITVFVSKKEGKLFVRKGFQPVFSWPVKFDHPELPLGTHLYTAVDANPDGVSFRWEVVSLPVDTTRKAEKHARRDKKGHRIEAVVQPAVALPPATATEALERIDIPPVALTRISALMSKGASLIISDQGLGGETGTETDFIVLTR